MLDNNAADTLRLTPGEGFDTSPMGLSGPTGVQTAPEAEVRRATVARQRSGPRRGTGRKRPAARLRMAVLGLLASVGLLSLTSGPANAYPWDPHVRVWFNVSACSGGAGQWGWWQNDAGESGWVTWNAGYQGYFDENRVSTSGSVTVIKWGLPGRTCGVRYFNITRPLYGNVAALGWIG
jgi:hypothetical protein